MRNFSKIFSILAILVLSMMLVFTLASCGGGDNTPSETNTNTDSNQTEENISLTVTFRQGDGHPDVVRIVKKGAGVTDIPTPQPVLGYNVSWENVDLSNVQIGDNGGNNSQVKNGYITVTLYAGGTLSIAGYPGYTSYTLSDGTTTTEEITAADYSYTTTEDVVLTITPVSGNNYFYSMSITY